MRRVSTYFGAVLATSLSLTGTFGAMAQVNRPAPARPAPAGTSTAQPPGARTEPATPERAAPQGRSKQVEVKAGPSWLKAQVLKEEADRFYIHYDGYPSSNDEWVPKDRTRPIEDPASGDPGAGVNNPAVDAVGKEITGKEPVEAGAFAPDAAVFPRTTVPSIKLPPSGLNPPKRTGGAGPPAGFFEKLGDLLVSSGATPYAIIARTDEPPGLAAGRMRLQRFDLTSGKYLGFLDVSPGSGLVDISPDGTLALTQRVEKASFKPGEMELWSFSAQGKRVKSWPAGDGLASVSFKWGDRDLARILDKDHLLTYQKGKIAVWNMNTGQAVYSLSPSLFPALSLSANRKQLAVVIDQSLCILEAATGKMLARFGGRYTGAIASAFEPSGKRLLVRDRGQLLVLDLASGETLHDHFAPPSVSHQFDWINDKLVLINRELVFDLERGIVVWSFNLPPSVNVSIAHVLKDKLWLLREEGGLQRTAILKSTPLASPEVLAAVKKANLNEMMAIKPGAKVSLLVNFSPEKARAELADSLRKKLEQNGLEVAENQPLRLVVNQSSGSPRQITYEMFNGQKQTASVADKIFSIQFERNGKALWSERAVYQAPMFVRITQGQSVQEYINEHMSKVGNPFIDVRIPKYVPDEKYSKGLGNTNLHQ